MGIERTPFINGMGFGTSKGKVISYEPVGALDVRKEWLKKRGNPMIIMGIIFLIGTSWLIFLIISSIQCLILGGLLYFFGFFFIAFGYYLRQKGGYLKPMIIYENGIDIPQPNGTVEFFSYSHFSTSSRRQFQGYNAIWLRRGGLEYPIVLWPELERRLPEIIAKLGQSIPGDQLLQWTTKRSKTDKFVPISPIDEKFITEISERELTKNRMYIIIAISIGFILALIIGIFGSPGFDSIAITVAAFPLITMIIYSGIILQLVTSSRIYKKPIYINRKLATILAVICLCISIGATAVYSQSNIQVMDPEKKLEDMDQIFDPTYIRNSLSNRKLYYNDWVILDGNLEINNCSFIFNCTMDESFGVLIKKDSDVFISSTSFRVKDSNYGFKFESLSPVTIEDSVLENLYTPSKGTFICGLEFYSSSSIVNTRIIGSKTSGIYAYGVTLNVKECIIENTTDNALRIVSSKLIMTNTEIIKCHSGINLELYSKAEISDSRITHCRYALFISSGSEARIDNTLLAYCTNSAIQTEPGHKIEENNIEFFKNDRNYLHHEYVFFSICCLSILLIINLIPVLLVLIITRKRILESLNKNFIRTNFKFQAPKYK